MMSKGRIRSPTRTASTSRVRAHRQQQQWQSLGAVRNEPTRSGRQYCTVGATTGDSGCTGRRGGQRPPRRGDSGAESHLAHVAQQPPPALPRIGHRPARGGATPEAPRCPTEPPRRAATPTPRPAPSAPLLTGGPSLSTAHPHPPPRPPPTNAPPARAHPPLTGGAGTRARVPAARLAVWRLARRGPRASGAPPPGTPSALVQPPAAQRARARGAVWARLSRPPPPRQDRVP